MQLKKYLYYFIGMKIKPEVDETIAKVILQKNYGMYVVEICELNSYDDKNFLIYVDKWVDLIYYIRNVLYLLIQIYFT